MENLRFKIAPSPDADGFVHKSLPPTASLTIACLPSLGVTQTLSTASKFSDQGYTVIPHIPARMIPSKSFLHKALVSLAGAGIGQLLVMAGDGQQEGPYSESLSLMEDITDFTNGKFKLGVLGHPEHHPKIHQSALYDALLAKQHLAADLTTQLCFDPITIHRYLRRLRTDRINLPVWISAPPRLPQADLKIAASAIGLGPSVRKISRQGPLGRRSFQNGLFDLEHFKKQFTTKAAGFHINTFNRAYAPKSASAQIGVTP